MAKFHKGKGDASLLIHFNVAFDRVEGRSLYSNSPIDRDIGAFKSRFYGERGGRVGQKHVDVAFLGDIPEQCFRAQ